MKKTKKYWTEMAGYLSGEMNDEQRRSYLENTEMDHQLNKDIELMKKTWTDFNSNPEEKYKDTGKAWKSLNQRLENEGLLEKPTRQIRMHNLNYAIRIAAVVLLVLAVGVPSVYYSVNNANKRKGIIEYNASEGIRTVDLPDGSRVFLNEGSRLEYKNDYELQRNVSLRGEGYFDVMSDPERPFRVNTGKVVVTVLGTSFNVKELAHEGVEVFVKSGKVRMNTEDNQNSVTLGPGQLCQANGTLETKELEDLNYLAWKTKEFKFVDKPVGEIIEVLEKAYHVSVIADNLPVSDMRLTTTYNDQSFDAILNTICTALDIHYEKDGKVYILK